MFLKTIVKREKSLCKKFDLFIYKILKLQFEVERVYFHIPYDKIRKHIRSIDLYKINLEVYFSAKDIDSFNEKDFSFFLENNLSYKPFFTVHGPFMDLTPSAIDPLIHDVTIKRFKKTLQIANFLNAKMVIFHSGYEKWKYNHKIDLWLEKSLYTWEEIIRYAQQMNLKIAIENIFEETPDNLKQLMEVLDSETIGLCFDTGHFNIFSKVSLSQWLDSVDSYIYEFHIHDNNGLADQHLAPGKGNFDFDTLIRKLNNKYKHCIITVEAHEIGDAKESFAYLKKNLNDF